MSLSFKDRKWWRKRIFSFTLETNKKLSPHTLHCHPAAGRIFTVIRLLSIPPSAGWQECGQKKDFYSANSFNFRKYFYSLAYSYTLLIQPAPFPTLHPPYILRSFFVLTSRLFLLTTKKYRKKYFESSKTHIILTTK